MSEGGPLAGYVGPVVVALATSVGWLTVLWMWAVDPEAITPEVGLATMITVWVLYVAAWLWSEVRSGWRW